MLSLLCCLAALLAADMLYWLLTCFTPQSVESAPVLRADAVAAVLPGAAQVLNVLALLSIKVQILTTEELRGRAPVSFKTQMVNVEGNDVLFARDEVCVCVCVCVCVWC
jgi:hypothetical protein